MKIDVRPPVVKVEPALLKELVKEVKETLATDLEMKQPQQSCFTLAELWNIRSKARTARSRFNR